jgi:hypothetical protein
MTIKWDDAVRKGREAANSQWTLGDLALEVEPKYGDHTLEQFADDIGVELRRIQEYRQVSETYPRNTRSNALSWTVHLLFINQEDRAELIKRKKWTAKQAREFIQHRDEDEQTAEELENKLTAFDGMWKLILEVMDAFHDDEKRDEFDKYLQDHLDDLAKEVTEEE